MFLGLTAIGVRHRWRVQSYGVPVPRLLKLKLTFQTPWKPVRLKAFPLSSPGLKVLDFCIFGGRPFLSLICPFFKEMCPNKFLRRKKTNGSIRMDGYLGSDSSSGHFDHFWGARGEALPWLSIPPKQLKKKEWRRHSSQICSQDVSLFSEREFSRALSGSLFYCLHFYAFLGRSSGLNPWRKKKV